MTGILLVRSAPNTDRHCWNVGSSDQTQLEFELRGYVTRPSRWCHGVGDNRDYVRAATLLAFRPIASALSAVRRIAERQTSRSSSRSAGPGAQGGVVSEIPAPKFGHEPCLIQELDGMRFAVRKRAQRHCRLLNVRFNLRVAASEELRARTQSTRYRMCLPLSPSRLRLASAGIAMPIRRAIAMIVRFFFMKDPPYGFL